MEKEFIATRDTGGKYEVKTGECHTVEVWLKLLEIDITTFEFYASYGLYKEA